MAGPAPQPGPGARLAQEARAGSRLALSRLLTAIESRTPTAEEALRALYPEAGSADPGAGLMHVAPTVLTMQP